MNFFKSKAIKGPEPPTGVTDMGTAESYLQIQGRVEILTDEATKKMVWNDHLESYFSGPDDPDYCVCKITPYRIEYQGHGKGPAGGMGGLSALVGSIKIPVFFAGRGRGT